VAGARPRPPIVKGNVHDLTGYGPRVDGDDTNAAVTTAAPGAVPPPARTFGPSCLPRYAPPQIWICLTRPHP